jgi:hypothetical protein
MIEEISTEKDQFRDLSELYSMNILEFSGNSIVDPPSFRDTPCGQCTWISLKESFIKIKCSQRCWFEGVWEYKETESSDSNSIVFVFKNEQSSFTLRR